MAIKVLSARLVNMIATGQIIDNPASVLKELLENSLDAFSSSIEIKILNAGKVLISVTDDGQGISRDDLEMTIVKNATSKISSIDDLNSIKTMGFRGEALYAISSVSKFKVLSSVSDEEGGYTLTIEGEKSEITKNNTCNKGTKIEVRNLFYNMPKKVSFLASDKTENNKIHALIRGIVLSNHKVRFKIQMENKASIIYDSGSLIDRICQLKLFGVNFFKNSIFMDYSKNQMRIYGYISYPTLNRMQSNCIYTFVNKRFVKDTILSLAINLAYQDLVPKGSFPYVVLFLEIPCNMIDVNVHPQKTVVRFLDPVLVKNFVFTCLTSMLNTYSQNVADVHANKFLNRGVDDVRKKEKIIADVGNNLPNFSTAQDTNNETSVDENVISDAQDPNIQDKDWENDFRTNASVVEKKAKNDSESSCQEISIDHNDGLRDPGRMISSFIPPYRYNTNTRNNHHIPSLLRQHATILADGEEMFLGNAKCQLYSSFIISETDDFAFIIDQHAAHERILYERIKSSGFNESQKLLLPYDIDMNYSDIIDSIVSDLNSKSFDIAVTDTGIRIFAVPIMMDNIEPFIQSILSNFNNSMTSLSSSLESIYAEFACHVAIKAGQKLSIDEMNVLLRDMEKTKNIAQCNHGRPTYVKFTYKNVEKIFSRS
ncbi:MAG: DNA mismatch repair MutL family protein [Candidatus Xenolissoclinum pacificiensis L6]|uniref:DNA mismatch repair protein MutL n=1 Tax=Candidatus Xenolissoclinum pacificiensis L6 TaxID=1401685 RepID=W2V0D9_9RICK|nr:MAG: DNA mismatch repair MutL family protein [Candidatus Xenolissoclinum pacificiensis L6]